MRNRRSVRSLLLLVLLAAMLLTACGSGHTVAAAPVPTQAAQSGTPAPAATEAVKAAQTPAPSAELSAEPLSEPKLVEAATVEEFLKAIAPDTTIRLTGRSYDLSRALGYGNFSGDWYDWEDLYDGWELVISNVKNLRIEAAHPGAEIVTEPRHANVIRFNNCTGVSFKDLTVGHTEGAGYCSGAVFHFTGCTDVSIEDCELYGCGTYGFEAERSRSLRCTGTVIRDCTYGAIYASGSSGVLLDGCTVYGISENDYMPVFSLSNCSGCAIINSLVRNCTASELVHCSYVRDFTLGGCEIVNNRLNGMFYSSVYPITVESCFFHSNELQQGWYATTWDGIQSERAVNSEGKAYEDYEFYDLTLGSVSWTQPADAVPDQKPVEASEDGMIHVHNIDELLASIAPGATIYLEDGVYALADAAGYGTWAGEYYYWMPCYDGPGLVISGVEELTITAGGPHRATVTAEPRYADVISFVDCSFITLKNFTAGHTQEPGACSGGVLSFQNSGRLIVMDCSLYGCGIVGVSCMGCFGGEVVRTEIHDCSDGAFFFTGCDGVMIERCNVHDIAGYTYQLFNSKNVTVDGRTLPDGVSW